MTNNPGGGPLCNDFISTCAAIRANTCVEATGGYAVDLGYHASLSLISDAIAAFTWNEMKATTEINFPTFDHGVLTTDQFFEIIE